MKPGFRGANNVRTIGSKQVYKIRKFISETSGIYIENTHPNMIRSFRKSGAFRRLFGGFY